MDYALKAALCLVALGIVATAAFLLLTRGILWGRGKR